MNPLELKLIRNFQNHFPFAERPFLRIASLLGTDENAVMDTINRLLDQGYIRRIGPVFSPNAVNIQLAVAISVPETKLQQFIASICFNSAISQVREYQSYYNVWFTLTAETRSELERFVETLLCNPGYEFETYTVRYEFSYSNDARERQIKSDGSDSTIVSMQRERVWRIDEFNLSEFERRIIRSVRPGLPVCSRPYKKIADSLDIRSRELTDIIQQLFHCGVIRRWGVTCGQRVEGLEKNHAMLLIRIGEPLVNAAIDWLKGVPGVKSGSLWEVQANEQSNLGLMIYGETSSSVHSVAICIIQKWNLKPSEYKLVLPHLRSGNNFQKLHDASREQKAHILFG